MELLCALVLLGMVALLVVPTTRAAAAHLQLVREADELCRVLRLAQARAMATEQANQVRFYPDSNRYRTYQPHVVDHQLAAGVRIDYVSFPRDSRGWIMCQFSPLGVPAAGGTVALSNQRGERIYVITTPVVGRVRVSPRPPAA
ncbi:MAG: hypothetical protein QHH05_05480 [Syntrophomonadaceae bacterium]|nr:hypothetical protein [Syntrophomonadaceae bacterium]